VPAELRCGALRCVTESLRNDRNVPSERNPTRTKADFDLMRRVSVRIKASFSVLAGLSRNDENHAELTLDVDGAVRRFAVGVERR